MPFVKLDCGILDSTLWIDREARTVFITALLMAIPHEITTAEPQLEVGSLKQTGWKVPPGDYGFVAAAGVGIVRRAGVEQEIGISALERLGNPEAESRSQAFEGRRLVRVDGGYLVLNFDTYRQKDHSSAVRSKRYREKLASRVTGVASRVTGRSVTQADADADAEAYVEKEEEAAAFEKKDYPKDMDVKAEDHAFIDWCLDHSVEATASRWRNWVLRAKESGRYAKAPSRPPTQEEILAVRREIIAKQEAENQRQ